MKIIQLEEVVSKAKDLAEKKLATGQNADEFVEIGEADEFKLYVAAGKTIKDECQILFHENPRDVFMLVLEGNIEFTFEDGEEISAGPGECFVLPKHLKHSCRFKELTVAIEGVYEKGL